MTTDNFLEQLKEIEADAAPKETAPKGRGAKAALKVADLKKTLGTVIEGANQALINLTVYGHYALSEDEKKGLVEAAAAEVQASKRLTNLLSSASKVTPHMQTIQVLSMITLSRWVMWQQEKAAQQPAPAGTDGAAPFGDPGPLIRPRPPVGSDIPQPIRNTIADGTEPPPQAQPAWQN